MTLDVGGCPPAVLGDAAFAALPPIVFRPSVGEDRVGRARGDGKLISAVDALGVVAFIGGDGRITARRDTPCGDPGLCSVEVVAGVR